MIIVTSGLSYLDIDAYAGVIAYAELLKKQGKQAIAVSTAPLNESVSVSVRSWNAPIKTTFTPSEDDKFALVDVSDPTYFDKIVNLANVSEVIDHHPGFESYWQQRIRDDAHIEFIGAACTIVYELWKSADLLELMSIVSARLLICGVLDNTLNFGAKITTQRDIDAYNALRAIADLPDDWAAQYFTECQEAILHDAVAAIQNDTKTVTFKSFGRPICFGQLGVWDGKQVLAKHIDTLRKALTAQRPEWFMNLISVGERKSYFVADNINVQKCLTKLLDVQFNGSVATADRLWLRKEVIKQDMQ